MFRVLSPIETANDCGELIGLYRHMVLAREVDALEERLVSRGQASFHVSGAGHEALAAMAQHLFPGDWLHCHYRDKALAIARGMPVRLFFDNLFCTPSSPSRGRQMSAHFSWRPGNVLSLCGPVGNNALQAVGIAAEVKDRDGQPIVLCCLGDGTTQQGEVMEAIAEAVRAALPVLFLIEDNGLAISSVTRGKTFFSLPTTDSRDVDAREFMGLELHNVDGADAQACSHVFGSVARSVRAQRKPGIVVMHVERLANHTHADDQRQYRPASELAELASRDPIGRLRESLIDAGVSDDRLRQIELKASALVRDAAAASQNDRTAPRAAKEAVATTAKRALRNAEDIEPAPGADLDAPGDDNALSMGAAINDVLRRRLRGDSRVTLFGQDIEDPKGDVFGITRGLSSEFGARVENAPLSEATIVGKAVGRALAGGRPVAFLQFADFLPLAFNQIASELATMHWRTDGEWDCPAIVMAPCGGYKQGLGPFHAQSFESIACHIPGLDVVCPSTAADARGLLEAAFDSGRPTLFFYPKALLNDPSVALPAAGGRSRVPLGSAALVGVGGDISLVTYGNGVKLCTAAAEWLREIGLSADILDLRCLSPLDDEAIFRSVRKTGRLLVVHEDVGTCGLGAEIMARVAEKVAGVRMAREVRADAFIPCNYADQLAALPSARTILESAARLLDLDVEWTEVAAPLDGSQLVRAVGSPSDETVTMLECRVAPGDRVREGELLAIFETVKAAIEYESPADGTIKAIFAAPGDRMRVGEPFLSLATDRSDTLFEGAGPAARPSLHFRRPAPSEATTAVAARASVQRDHEVGILSVASKLGSETVRNADLAASYPGRSAADIDRLTGIASRRRAAAGESAVTLGTAAAREALERAALSITDIDAVICATGTPGLSTPSLACRILYELAPRGVECQAHDISAACSGYLYGLQGAYDVLQATPNGRVLLITSEILTPLIDETDFETSLLFSDGASATVLGAGGANVKGRPLLARPVLSAAGEPGCYLTVPASRADGTISMNGNKVFASAVRSMSDMLTRACAAQTRSVHDLDLVIPHQANRRILDAVAARLGLPIDRFAANIRELGNTSSSTIPICLGEHWSALKPGQTIGLTAFGGGFTAGAALLEMR